MFEKLIISNSINAAATFLSNNLLIGKIAILSHDGGGSTDSRHNPYANTHVVQTKISLFYMKARWILGKSVQKSGNISTGSGIKFLHLIT